MPLKNSQYMCSRITGVVCLSGGGPFNRERHGRPGLPGPGGTEAWGRRRGSCSLCLFLVPSLSPSVTLMGICEVRGFI